MKRANIKDYGVKYKNFILLETLQDALDFYNEKTFGMMKESASSLVKRAKSRKQGKSIPHGVNIITGAVELIREHNKKGVVYLQCEVMANYQNEIDRLLINGDKIAINPINMVSYFTPSKDAKIKIISEKEVYTVDDIRIISWDGGTHFYAKIDLIDVVIDGEQKWNTEKEAKDKANEFLNNL